MADQPTAAPVVPAAPVQAQPAPVKPGWQTTEFWITCLSHVPTLALTVGPLLGLTPAAPVIIAVSLGASAIVGAFYNHGRAAVKQAALDAGKAALAGIEKGEPPLQAAEEAAEAAAQDLAKGAPGQGSGA